jgi:hypothetical protein
MFMTIYCGMRVRAHCDDLRNDDAKVRTWQLPLDGFGELLLAVVNECLLTTKATPPFKVVPLRTFGSIWRNVKVFLHHDAVWNFLDISRVVRKSGLVSAKIALRGLGVSSVQNREKLAIQTLKLRSNKWNHDS